MMENYPKFAIVNTTEKPCAGLVAQFIEGVGYCYNSQLLPGYEYRKQYNGMMPPRPTSLEDFGFEITERPLGIIEFNKVRSSVATYEDGERREWQDVESFALPKLPNTVKKSRGMA